MNVTKSDKKVANKFRHFQILRSCSQAWKTSNTIHEYICNDWSYLSELHGLVRMYTT